VRAAVPTGLAVAIIAATAGCGSEQVAETQALIVAETLACVEARDNGDQVNAYAVAVYELMGPVDSPSAPPCVDCVMLGTCAPVATLCRCAPRRPPSTITFNDQLVGLRFSGLSPDARYCLGFVAYDYPDIALPPSARPMDCPCDAAGRDLVASRRACGVSPFPGHVGINAGAIIVSADCGPRCPATVGP